MLSSRSPSDDISPKSSHVMREKDKADDNDTQGGRMSIFIHKRVDQVSNEALQPLLRLMSSKCIKIYI